MGGSNCAYPAVSNIIIPEMKCPNCQTTLNISDRNGIEIDFCPSCRGIWLDRGELDKILERQPGNPQDNRNRDQNQNRDDVEGGRRGFLADLFDF